MKRAANCMQSAGGLQSQPLPQTDSLALAAHCFVAAAPAISDILIEQAGTELQQLAAAGLARDAGNAASSSSSSTPSSAQSSQQQSMPSLALLTLLLARSLVVLADALEAAAAAAGSTTAQLLARWVSRTFVFSYLAATPPAHTAHQTSHSQQPHASPLRTC
jgi:hypothetical protein